MYRLSIAVLCAGAGLQAQTFIVAQNGTGNFTDLPPAIAAVPSGATLHVEPGTYSQFTIANKSLTIVVGPGGAEVGVGADVTIGPLGSTDSVRIHGLGFRSGPLTIVPPPRIRLLDCAGTVVLDHGTVTCVTPLPFVVDRCTNVHLLDVAWQIPSLAVDNVLAPALFVQQSSIEIAGCRIACPPSAFFYTTRGSTGLELVQSSAWLANSVVAGGQGSLEVFGVAGPGGIGVHATSGSSLSVTGRFSNVEAASITGGPGGPSFVGAVPVGPGGDGLVVDQGSVARVYDPVLAGGQGSVTGQPSVVDGTSQLLLDPTAITPRGFLAGTVAPGNTVQYSLDAAPGALGWLLFGFDFTFTPVPVLDIGLQAVLPVAVVGPVIASPAGAASIASIVPPAWPRDLMVAAQWVAFDVGTTRIETSNSFTATSQ